MRRAAGWLLVLFTFSIPWEYSLDFGEPWGNIARILGLFLLLIAALAVLEAGQIRTPGLMQWLVFFYLLYFSCSCFWSIDPMGSFARVRAYFQEMMVIAAVWEFAETSGDLRALLRAWVAGSWILAILTLASFASAEAGAVGQIRFVAAGQDPNDVARFLDLGFPLAALLFDNEEHWTWRLMAGGYLPVGLFAVLLTGSRGGFLAAAVAFAGSSVLLLRGHRRRMLAAAIAFPAFLCVLWVAIPRATLGRLASISEQLNGGDLNQRLMIWMQGWSAFVQAPLVGRGAGAFVLAAGLAPADTAHNTMLSIAVEGGLCALTLATAIFVSVVWLAWQTSGGLRCALVTELLVWLTTSLVATVEESRTTWLLFGVVAASCRLSAIEMRGSVEIAGPPTPAATRPALAGQ